MKLVTQTKLGDKGNCFQACLASILELDIDSIPVWEANCWQEQVENWLEQFGIRMVVLNGPLDGAIGIATGEGPRGRRHAVVWYKGCIIWDPYPSRAGLAEEPTEYCYLLPEDPVMLRRDHDRDQSRRTRDVEGRTS